MRRTLSSILTVLMVLVVLLPISPAQAGTIEKIEKFPELPREILIERALNGVTDRPGISLVGHVDGLDVEVVLNEYATTQILERATYSNGLTRVKYLTFGIVTVIFDPSVSRTDEDSSYTVRSTVTMYWDETYDADGDLWAKITKVEGSWHKLDTTWYWRNAELKAWESYPDYTDTYSVGTPSDGVTYSFTPDVPWLEMKTDYDHIYAHTRIEMYRSGQNFWFTVSVKEQPHY